LLGLVLLHDIANFMLCESDECAKVIAEPKESNNTQKPNFRNG